MAPTKEKVSNNIPNDIVFDILSKLPVKSLKRFGCVRESWANLFENPQFMSMYRNNFLSKYGNDNSCLLLKQLMPNTYRDNLFLLSGETFENRVKLDWPPPFQEHDVNILILGSAASGTLCLYKGWGSCPTPMISLEVVMWNPSTEEFKVIPHGCIYCPPGVEIYVDLHGFGYDHVTDDYKLIRNISFFEDFQRRYDIMEDRPNVPEPLWQIYSLRSNCWRELDVEMSRHALTEAGFAVYLNGVCHWWGYKQPNSEEVLVSFNLSDEVFHTTTLDKNNCYLSYGRHLAVLKGYVAMISMYVDTPCYDISILGEPGVMKSWTKLFSIGPLPCVEHFIGVGKKGDIFFRKNNDELAWFNLNSQMIEEIGVKGDDSFCQIVIYEENILSIEGVNN